jgi:predicted GNAT family acetyltransferase
MKISDIIVESKEIRTQKRDNGFTIDLYDDGKHVGQYTHAREDDIVRNQAEIFPEYRNKGYGTMLLLAAIKTADDLGLDFEEDTQSLTPAMSRIYDELDDSGMIYGGNGAWAISPSGEVELEDFLNEDLRAWFGKGKKGGAGGGGWDAYNSKGERIGKCGDTKGSAKPKCLSKSAAAKLRNADKNKDGKKDGKAGIARAVKRKRASDPNKDRKGKAKNVAN